MKRLITPERLLEENEALRQIIREALPWVEDHPNASAPANSGLLERMRAAIGD